MYLHSDGIPPYAEFALPTLVAQQRYDISLHLVIPATESNFALGNFMATLKLATTSNETLSVIRRPVGLLSYFRCTIGNPLQLQGYCPPTSSKPVVNCARHHRI